QHGTIGSRRSFAVQEALDGGAVVSQLQVAIGNATDLPSLRQHDSRPRILLVSGVGVAARITSALRSAWPLFRMGGHHAGSGTCAIRTGDAARPTLFVAERIARHSGACIPDRGRSRAADRARSKALKCRNSIQQAGARIVVPRRICENISHCGRNRSGNSLSKTSLRNAFRRLREAEDVGSTKADFYELLGKAKEAVRSLPCHDAGQILPGLAPLSTYRRLLSVCRAAKKRV